MSLRMNGVKIRTEWAKGLLKKYTRKGLAIQTTRVSKALITRRVPV